MFIRLCAFIRLLSYYIVLLGDGKRVVTISNGNPAGGFMAMITLVPANISHCNCIALAVASCATAFGIIIFDCQIAPSPRLCQKPDWLAKSTSPKFRINKFGCWTKNTNRPNDCWALLKTSKTIKIGNCNKETNTNPVDWFVLFV